MSKTDKTWYDDKPAFNYIQDLFTASDNNIVFLTGHSGAGKDTLADKLLYAFPHISTLAYAFADPLKETAAHITGIPVRYFYNAVLKDTPLPSNFTDKTVNNRIYSANGGIRRCQDVQYRELKIERGITPRQILHQIGASADFFPKWLWARCVADSIKKEISTSEREFGKGNIRHIHIIKDLRYPHERKLITSTFPDMPTITLYLDTGEPSPVIHESEYLIDQNDCETIKCRTWVSLEKETNALIPNELGQSVSERLTLYCAIGAMLRNSIIYHDPNGCSIQ